MTSHPLAPATRDDEEFSAMRALPVLDLGQDSPLNINGESHPVTDQRGVSTRWFFASIVIALAGATLIGMSIVIALKGTHSTITLPQLVATSTKQPSHGSAGLSGDETPKKTDKILRSEVTVSAKLDYRAPAQITTARGVAIKNRQFIHLSTSLALRTGVYAASIPRFNANRLLNQTDGGDDQTFEATTPTEVSDADVSIVHTDLTDFQMPEDAMAWSDEDVALLIKKEYDFWERSPESIPNHSDLVKNLSIIQGADALNFDYIENSNPFQSIDVEVVPENVTRLSRATTQQMNSYFEERNIIYQKRDSLEEIIRSFGADKRQTTAIFAALGGKQRVESMTDGQYVRALFSPLGIKLEGKPLARVMILGERGIEAIAAADDRGHFVSVPPPVLSQESGGADSSVADDEDGAEGARLYESVYETLAKNDMPREFADDLVRIFGYEIDFQRRVALGDSIEIFYSRDEDNSSPPELLFASITIGGDSRPAFRYQGKDGLIEYFDPEGRSLKKFLLRKPVGDSVLRSGFGMRFHPILRYSRLHSGVDWAGKTGTPIYAAGSGTVIKAGRASGYGNRIEIEHANGYVTTYSHQSKFAPGMQPGVKVKQGQLIGYIGNTGLSTGPHLHYEVLINGRFVDPMTIKVPRTRELDGLTLDEFKQQRERIIAQIKRTGATSLRYAQNNSN